MLNVLPFSSRYLQLFHIPYRFAKEFLRASRQDRKNTGMAVSVVTNRENIRFKTYAEVMNEACYVLDGP